MTHVETACVTQSDLQFNDLPTVKTSDLYMPNVLNSDVLKKTNQFNRHEAQNVRPGLIRGQTPLINNWRS